MPLKEGFKKMNLNVEVKLHNDFKAVTASQGKSMTDVLLEFIRDYVQKHRPQERRPKGR
jgi:ParG